MPVQLPSSQEWAERCSRDGEFMLAARHWDGGLDLDIDGRRRTVSVTPAGVTGAVPHGPGVLQFGGTGELWERLLAPVPPRFYTDIFAALGAGQGMTRQGSPVVHAQYYSAAMRAIELLRPASEATPVLPAGRARFDAPRGSYLHLELAGHDHRIYIEEAGEGIPLLLQHTAGCHGSQWRHLFEDREVTDHFRLIAYDLPFHGKSVPPVSRQWWAEPYRLEGAFLRAVPLGIATALELERPVFMGCSVGGLLALDLAWRHPERFRAVISVEGALNVAGATAFLPELWHPQVSNEYKARVMEGLTSPTSPRPYVKETSFVYAAGWPPAFLGDLYYYLDEYDLRAHAHEVDTGRCGVHILSGEYDHSGTSELGRAAHEAIAGSTWQEMRGVGHFPMSENPAAFLAYLKPVLQRIRQ